MTAAKGILSNHSISFAHLIQRQKPGLKSVSVGRSRQWTYGRWSTAICYDTCYPELIRQVGEAGAALLIAPTSNFAQFAQSALSMADYRAIENGFTLLRPTGKGLSAMIDDRGRLLLSQDYFGLPSGILIFDLPLHATPTIYSRIGDLLAYLCAAGLASIAALALLRHKPLAIAAASR